jgi:hypothetical protein
VRARVKDVDSIDDALFCCDVKRAFMEAMKGAMFELTGELVRGLVWKCNACGAICTCPVMYFIVGPPRTAVDVRFIDIEEGS